MNVSEMECKWNAEVDSREWRKCPEMLSNAPAFSKRVRADFHACNANCEAHTAYLKNHDDRAAPSSPARQPSASCSWRHYLQDRLYPLLSRLALYQWFGEPEQEDLNVKGRSHSTRGFCKF